MLCGLLAVSAAGAGDDLEILEPGSGTVNFILPSGTVGSVLSAGETPAAPELTVSDRYREADGLLYECIGWALSEGADIPCELTPLTAGETVRNYYPVYKNTEAKYAIFTADSVTVGEGEETLAADVAAMPDGATVRLFSDVWVKQTVAFPAGQTSYFDCNGYSYFKHGAKATNFSTRASTVLYLYSSRAGGRLSNATDQKTEGMTYDGPGAPIVTTGGDATEVHIGLFTATDGTVIPGSHLSLYSCVAVDFSSKNGRCYVDGASVYRNVSDYAASFITRGDTRGYFEIKNCLLVTTPGSGGPLFDYRSRSYGETVVENCAIYTYDRPLFAEARHADITLRDCYVAGLLQAGTAWEQSTLKIEGNCYFQRQPAVPGDGTVSVLAKVGGEMTPVAQAVLGEGMALVRASRSEDWEFYYNTFGRQYDSLDYELKKYKVAPRFDFCTAAEEQTAEVIWKYGDEQTTEKYLIGSDADYTASIPHGVYAYESVSWTGETGESTKSLTAGTHIFTATMAPKLWNVRYNLKIYSNLKVRVYLPYGEEVIGIYREEDGYNIVNEVPSVVSDDGIPFYIVDTEVNLPRIGTTQRLYVEVDIEGTPTVLTVEFSVAEYIYDAIYTSSVTDAEKRLLFALADAAYHANRYCNGKNSGRLEKILQDDFCAMYRVSYTPQQGGADGTAALAAAVASARLNLDAQTDIVFTAKEGFVGRIVLTYRTGIGDTATVTLHCKGQGESVSVSQLVLMDLGTPITVAAFDSTGTPVCEGTYTLENYISATLQKGELAAAMAQAFYNYYCEAYDYTH